MAVFIENEPVVLYEKITDNSIQYCDKKTAKKFITSGNFKIVRGWPVGQNFSMTTSVKNSVVWFWNYQTSLLEIHAGCKLTFIRWFCFCEISF